MGEGGLDPDGYPTAEALERIAQWPVADVAGLWAFVKALWHWDDWARDQCSAGEAAVGQIDKDDLVLRLATGGWSGNEDLVRAYRRNALAWTLTWRLSAAGGLHIFSIFSQRQT